jgi:hypothetical protein
MRSLVAGLCSIAGRGACTDAERRAALWLHGQIPARAYVETVWVRPQRWAVLALGCLLCSVGGLAAVAAALPGLIAAAFGALSLCVEAVGRVGPLRALFPRRATQHVLTDMPDYATPLIIAAAYDAPRRGLVLNERWRRRRLPAATLPACGLVVAGTAGARVAEVDAAWLGAVQLVPTVVLLAALAAAVDIGLSGWAPGANDNASGVAVALALFAELQREPPRALAPALLLAGAGRTVPRAARGYVEGVWLELGPCGLGRPALRARHPQAQAAAARAAGALGVRQAGPRPAANGVRITGLDERGVVPRAHQEDDTEVDDAALEAALDVALAVVDALDAELRLSAGERGATPRA